MRQAFIERAPREREVGMVGAFNRRQPRQPRGRSAIRRCCGRQPGFAWQCLIARRLAERGVRFIELIDSGAAETRYSDVLSDYLHLKPVRARMVTLKQRLFDYPWSSYPLFVAARARPAWIEPRVVRGEFGFDEPDDSNAEEL